MSLHLEDALIDLLHGLVAAQERQADQLERIANVLTEAQAGPNYGIWTRVDNP